MIIIDDDAVDFINKNNLNKDIDWLKSLISQMFEFDNIKLKFIEKQEEDDIEQLNLMIFTEFPFVDFKDIRHDVLEHIQKTRPQLYDILVITRYRSNDWDRIGV